MLELQGRGVGALLRHGGREEETDGTISDAQNLDFIEALYARIKG